MGRFHWSLLCSPQPLARLLRVLPKLAIIFLLVHFVLMIYSVVNQSPEVQKNGSNEPESTTVLDFYRDILPDSFKGNSSLRKAAIRPFINRTKVKQERERLIKSYLREYGVLGATRPG